MAEIACQRLGRDVAFLAGAGVDPLWLPGGSPSLASPTRTRGGAEPGASAEPDAQSTTGTVSALMGSLEVRDGYTDEHSRAVAEMTVEISRCLGLDGQELDDLRTAATLHDIGKLGVPDAILNKPAPLNEYEWALMRRHPEIGAELVASMAPVAHLAPVIRAGHEHWDGTGYPDQLAGEDIPLGARVILIADAFHAMTSDRPYRSRIPLEEAREELEANAGTQFWPEGVRVALEIL